MPSTQANVEYWFRLLYECIYGECYGSAGIEQILSWASHAWIWIVIIGYVLSIIGLIIIIYCTVRLFELRKREHEFYHTLITPPKSVMGGNPRWEHIKSLIDGKTASEWKEAIIEADIMLDDEFTKKGYVGDSLGEKLKSIEHSDLATLKSAWEAHKVRNQIAHQGSTFDLTEPLARRTISHYEAVFRELKAI